MAQDELPARAVEHLFTQEDRLAQLDALSRLCDRLATLLSEHGESWEAEQFAERAEMARHLFSAGFAREDLNDLGGQFPMGPWWLNPKALDFNAPREPWQEEVATLHAEASSTATDLRAVATLRYI